MKITTDPTLISFKESRTAAPAMADCTCSYCAARITAASAQPKAGKNRRRRTIRGTCLATTLLAGAGVASVGLGARTANAEQAPSHSGWDGSVYWFKNSSGIWRYTKHYAVYLARSAGTGIGGGPAPAAASVGDGGSAGIQQGWDGSVYWFLNSSGVWRYTKYYDTYLARTAGTAGTAAQAQAAAPDGGSAGIQQGWDGSVYWFLNSSGVWRYTKYYDTYLARTAGTGTTAGTTAGTGTGTGTGGSQVSAVDYEAAVDYALAQLGRPYVWGGDGPNGFDCSGLVQQAYRRAGIELPRVADDQYAATTPIDPGDLRRGDLVFWSYSDRASGIHHVGIYLGDGTYVEAPHPGTNVRVSQVSAGYYPTHFGRPQGR